MIWLFLDFKVLSSTDSHQLGFADASFRFVPLQRLHRRACQTVFTPPLPISRFSQPLNGCSAFFGVVGLFRPTGTSRVSVFRVLRYIRSVAVSSSLLPSLFAVSCRVSSGAYVGSLTSWPLPFVRFTTSLRPGPLLIVSFELVPVVRFGSASELCSRLFRALPVAWFHPCAVLALSLDLLSPFEVSGFRCPARPYGLPFPPSQFRLPWGFSAPLKLLSLGVTRVALPLWGFFLLPFFGFKLDSGHGLSLFT